MYAVIFVNGEPNKVYQASQNQVARIATRYKNQILKEEKVKTIDVYYQENFTADDVKKWTRLSMDNYQFNKRLNKKEVI